jgi:hypothetical protein
MVLAMKQPNRALVAALDPFMIANGFKFLKSREAYFRKYDGGFDYFSWSTYPLSTGEKWKAGYHEGHYGIGKRVDKIEQLTREVMPIYGSDNERYAFTIYRGVGNPAGNWFAFDPVRDKALCLRFDHLEEDAINAAGHIEAMLKTDGRGWYERYSDPVALSRDINDPLGGLDPHPLVNNVNYRPLVGVAAACVGEPERVPTLVDEWLSTINDWDKKTAGKRPPLIDDVARKLTLITDKAKVLGYLNSAH